MKPDMNSGSAAARGAALPVARLVLAIGLIVGSAAAVADEANDQSADTSAPTSAKWAARKLHFTYMGFTSHYSCDGLRGQMTSILQELGVRDDLVVKSTGCTRFEGPEEFPGVDATFSVLVPAGSSEKGAAGSPAVAARWETVTLDSDATRRTGQGECELIEQVKQYVLPLFTTRNLSYSTHCFPHSDSLAGARLSVEVLRPVKPPPPKSPPA
jgi:hypothetical protein